MNSWFNLDHAANSCGKFLDPTYLFIYWKVYSIYIMVANSSPSQHFQSKSLLIFHIYLIMVDFQYGKRSENVHEYIPLVFHTGTDIS